MTDKEKALETLARYLIHEFGDYFQVDDIPDSQAPDEAIRLIDELRAALHDVMADAIAVVQSGSLNKSTVYSAMSREEIFDGDYSTLPKHTVRSLLMTMLDVKARLGERPIVTTGGANAKR